MTTTDFICTFSSENVHQLALRRNNYKDFNDKEWHYILCQIDGHQRALKKLPEISQTDGIIYPEHINMEQCSSEATAKYKATIIKQAGLTTLVDLTGGYGIDCIYMSDIAKTAYYIEQNTQLAQIVKHNIDILQKDITVCNQTAETFLHQDSPALPCNNTLVYADPARRATTGKKMFLLEDCEPNILQLLPLIKQKARFLMLKLSPMLDISLAWRRLQLQGDTFIVASNSEVKEILLFIDFESRITDNMITAYDTKDNRHLSFTKDEERNTTSVYAKSIGKYLYEPHPAITKAGCYSLICKKWDLKKLASNSHLYTSDTYYPDFWGKVFETTDFTPEKGSKYNILCRNYPLPPAQLAKKLKISEGGELYIVATRIGQKPLAIVCKRLI